VTHGATIAEAQFDGITVTIELTHTERLDDLHRFGPLTHVDIITADGAATELDLTPVQVRMLARILNADTGASYLAEALTSAEGCIGPDACPPSTAGQGDEPSEPQLEG
jgi:hypothetical protein